jgi:general L-amino acid transport system substrate-binding protein
MAFLKMAGVAVSLLLVSAVGHAGQTFNAVKEKGFVQCGVHVGNPGFSLADSNGNWSGLDIDLCKAIAVAMFGDASKFKLTPLNSQQRFTALQSGEIDVLTRNSTATLSRDTTLGLVSAGINYYDSQGVMVKTGLGLNAAQELNGAAICVQPGTTTELNLADWFRSHRLAFEPVVISSPDEAMRSFAAGRCDAFTSDKSQLATMRSSSANPGDYEILAENFSKEPLGPMVRRGDEEWFNVVRWTLNAMLEAEEYGITSANVDDMTKSDNPNVQRILGVSGELGHGMGLDSKWVYNITKQVGNYGESFERNLGMDSAMKLPRGLNAQWRDNGLMYGWPLR